MRHPRYCLTHHPGICSNITNATHFSTPAMPTTLAHLPLYPCQCTTHATQAGTSPQRAAHITHASASPTLACHPRQHANNANTPPMLARLPRKRATHGIYSHFSNGTSFLKLLGIQLRFALHFFFKQSIFDPCPENCLSFSEKSLQKIVQELFSRWYINFHCLNIQTCVTIVYYRDTQSM